MHERLLDDAPILVGHVDADERYRYVNSAYEELFGLPRARIVGRTIREILGEPAYAAIEREVARGLAGQRVTYGRWLERQSGEQRYWRTTYVPQRDGGFFVYASDITDKRRVEEELLASEERLRAIFESAGVGIALLDLDGWLVRANEALCELLGYPEETLIELPAGSLVHPEDVPLLTRAGEEIARGERKRASTEVRVTRADGGTRWVSVDVSRLHDRAGEPVNQLAVVRDLTPGKEAALALQESEQRHRSLFENAAVGMARVAPDGTWLAVNDRLCELLGYELEELMRLSVRDLTYFEDYPEDERLTRALFAGSIDRYELDKRFVRKDGSLLWGHITISCVRDEEGSVLYAIGIVEDIDARKEAEAALLRLNLALEQRVQERTEELSTVNRELDAFNYSVSHDLRAPLRAIDGFSQALLEDFSGELDERGRHYLERLRSGATRMGEMIDALLMLSRLTRGEVARRPVDLGELARECLASLRQEQPERLVELQLSGDLVVSGDEGLLRILMGNLLGNAWKFTRTRELARIEVGAEAQGEGRVVHVRDNGVGFDPNYAERLFVPFQRLHSADEFEGQGIGLATVQRIVNRLGGTIWARGEPGVGATFYLHFRGS